MKIVAICRGAPGLGRVAPALALTRSLAASGPATVIFASYEAGARHLAALGENVVDLGSPDGLFIDSVAPQALRVLELIEDAAADLVLIDGEFFLPVTLAHLGVPVVYLANPHDLTGPPTPFRRVNSLLLAHADAVLISSLSCREPVLRPCLVPGTPCLEVPALVRDIPLGRYRTAGPVRVLVSTGGGSLHNPQLRIATDQALAQVLDTLAPLVDAGEIGDVSVVLGADAALRRNWQHDAGWLNVIPAPADLAGLYPCHDLLISRAGRNTIAEAAYCGIPAILLPVTADPHRAAEQTGNALAVGHLPGVFAVRAWHDPAALRDTLARVLPAARQSIRRVGWRGNDSAAAFITRLCQGGIAGHCLTFPDQGARP
jgi:UDP:flavonoid glycosyltransferase YjiC (YdhE family)